MRPFRHGRRRPLYFTLAVLIAPTIAAGTTQSAFVPAAAMEDSERGPSMTPFQAFEEDVLRRILDAQENVRIDDSSSRCPTPVVTLHETRSETAQRGIGESRLQREMRNNGGCIVVRLGVGLDAAAILGDMWRLIAEDVFRRGGKGIVDREAAKARLLRRQVLTQLTRDDIGRASSPTAGYEYLETCVQRRSGVLVASPGNSDGVDDGESDSGGLKRMFTDEAEGAAVLDRVFRLLTSVGMDVAAWAAGVPTDDLSRTVLVDDGSDWGFPDDIPVSCSVHRLCRYAVATAEGELMENLRAHTDWTLVTLVPVSDVTGLEVWNDAARSWVRPEDAARGHWADNSSSRAASIEEREKRSAPWNSHYVVVMAGKWLEILTGGEIKAAVHRVVSAAESEARMSAPFFLRPRNHLPLEVQRRFGAGTDDDSKGAREKDGAAALECMKTFLHDFCEHKARNIPSTFDLK